MTRIHSAPKFSSNKGVAAAIKKALGKDLISVAEISEEIEIHVKADKLIGCMMQLRDTCDYQQLMEIAGVDWPDRDPRFEVVYCLLSLTKNHRIRVHISTNEDTPVPSVTGIWPVAGWHKRVMYEPVQLAQDFRSFDFMSPWEGAEYILPGDEKGSKT
jgi:NADH-quinone oxidoreductase subunit C